MQYITNLPRPRDPSGAQLSPSLVRGKREATHTHELSYVLLHKGLIQRWFREYGMVMIVPYHFALWYPSVLSMSTPKSPAELVIYFVGMPSDFNLWLCPTRVDTRFSIWFHQIYVDPNSKRQASFLFGLGHLTIV